jgi:hypothetical protein
LQFASGKKHISFQTKPRWFEYGNLRQEYVKRTFPKAHFRSDQGCQMVSFQTKIPYLGKFWRALEWKMLINFMAIWNILWLFHDHLVHFVFIFPVLVSCTKKNLATLVMTCTGIHRKA